MNVYYILFLVNKGMTEITLSINDTLWLLPSGYNLRKESCAAEAGRADLSQGREPGPEHSAVKRRGQV